MTTLADIKSEIADDVDDTTGEYTAQIERAVLAAIRYCERSTYYFNSTRDLTFSTVNGQAFYDNSDLTEIGSLVRAQAVFIDDGTNVSELLRMTTEDIEVAQSASGKPVYFAYFEQKLRLYPTPDQAYTIRLQLTPYRLAALVDDTDTNAWLTEAYDLVKARAKYILHKDTLKDVNLASEALNDYNDQHRALKGETNTRNGTGYIRPTQF